MKNIFILLFIFISSLYSDSYYNNGALVELTNKHQLSTTKLSYTDSENQTIYITNKLIIKLLADKSASYYESRYPISFYKQFGKVIIFKVEDINNVLNIAKEIYVNEAVVYAQPSFLKAIKHQAITFHEDMIDKPMTKRATLASNEDTKSMLDSESSVNYYKYYDDVFRYEDDTFWHLYNNGSWNTTAGYDGDTYNITSVDDVDTNVLDVLDNGTTGKGVKVLVIDSSFELTHPDLRFSNTYNFNLQNRDITPDSTADYHGTAVAGVIGANRGNNYGIMGVAPDSYLIAFNGLFEIIDDDVYLESYIETFYKALELDVDVINCSWTSTGIVDEASVDAINTFITQARDGKGGFVVFSSGNEASTSLLNEPALAKVISVGSIEADGSKSTYSNYGKRLDLVAPSNFVSLDLTGTNGFSTSEMGFVAGTSFSAPIVAGIIALMLEVNPDITLDNALDIIYSTTKKVGSYTYSYNIDDDNRYNTFYTKSYETGYGLIDAKTIVEKARPITSDSNTTEASKESILDNLHEGWNFIGTNEAITDFSIFDTIQIVWVYKDNSWLGYSPNSTYVRELRRQNKLLTSIDKNSGMWVYK